jgi:hypothetical protein
MRSQALSEQKAAVSLDAADRAMAKDEGSGARVVSRSGRLFENRGGVWTDTQHGPRQRVIRIQPFGEAYMELLRVHPDLAAAAALGEHVILSGRGLSIEIVKDGKSTLSAAEWSAVQAAFR